MRTRELSGARLYDRECPQGNRSRGFNVRPSREQQQHNWQQKIVGRADAGGLEL